MRVLLRFELDCDVDTAWRVIRSPAGLKQVSAPLMVFDSLEADGFPESWAAGGHPVAARALGIVPLGRQLIAIGFPPARRGARFVRDAGGGISGVFTAVHEWEHTMAVAPLGNGKTLYRDQLRFGAGWTTPLLWPMYWAFWQWRGIRMRQLAHTW